MKKIITAIFAIAFTMTVSAQTVNLKYFQLLKNVAENGGADKFHGKELNEFQVGFSENAISTYIHVPITDVKKIKVKGKILLRVIKLEQPAGNSYTVLDWYWPIPAKPIELYTECNFWAGDYSITLMDSGDTSKIFYRRQINVKPNSTTVALNEGRSPYDKTKFKLWSCKSVSKDWKAVGVTNKIKLGECITFYFESQELIKAPGTMRWKIYKIDDSGKEIAFVNQHDQNTILQAWKRMYYEECDEFREKGKFRVYFAIKNESEAYYGIVDKDYFGKVDITVE